MASMEDPPLRELAEDGIGDEAAYELINSELLLDGSARLNLATFVTTWMPSQADRLMAQTAEKNMIDKDEYPQTAEIEVALRRRSSPTSGTRPASDQATGCSTTGSSEAVMLGGLALKWRWRERMRAAGAPTDKPNLVAGINVQVCWEKFCRYWDVEPRLVPMEGERYTLGAAEAAARCDENTIGVAAILGSTFDGSYEPVAEIARGARRARSARRASTSRSMSMPPPAASSRPSSSRSSSGTSASRASSRSTPRGTSTGSSTPASAGRCGATATHCRTI